MTDHSFLDNTNINESNSLVNLVDQMNPSNKHAIYLNTRFIIVMGLLDRKFQM